MDYYVGMIEKSSIAVALLRGVNVSGANIVRMADLRAALTEAGLEDVATYIQSGNILFRRSAGSLEDSRDRIAAVLKDRFDAEVAVLVMDAHRLERIAAASPYHEDPESRRAAVYISFLEETPTIGDTAGFDELATSTEAWTLENDVFYLHCPEGYGRTKLSNTAVESVLGVRATTRNMRTIRKLVDLADQ